MGDESPIHHKYASLLSPEMRNTLAEVKARKTRAASFLSASSDVSEFLEYKIKEVELDIDYTEMCKKGLEEASKRETIEEGDLSEALQTINHDRLEKKREYVALKRQKRLIQDDIEEGGQSNLEKAYASAMLHRVKMPPQLGKSGQNQKKHAQENFTEALEAYYGTVRTVTVKDNEVKHVFCPVTKMWWMSKAVKAAHLVPKSLQSIELSYLFGVGSMNLSDPRNGLLVHHGIEEALDRGTAVIVPLPSKDSSRSEWKILLTNENLRSRMAVEMPPSNGELLTWDDLDERILEFSNDNRPARRYLYFKYLMTYMMSQESGNTKWADKIPNKGTMWCSPGPYLRKSMLKSLARQVSDYWLPEALYSQTTFDDSEEEPNKSSDQEKALAMSLGLKLEDAKAESLKRPLGEDSSDDEGDDEED